MAEELHELAVRLSPEGAEETQRSLDKTSETFEETADTADRQSAKLGNFAQKWKGAMSAIVAGLGVAAAGLLSKVPVIGESMGALETVIDSVALKIDEDLRPALNDFNQDVVETSNKVDESEGTFEALTSAFVGIAEAVDGLEASMVQDFVDSLPGGEFIPDWMVDFQIDLMTMDWIGLATDINDQLKDLDLSFPDISLPDVPAGEWAAAIKAAVVGEFLELSVRAASALRKLAARVHTGFELMWDLAVKFTKDGVNMILGVVENMANRIMESLPSFVTDRLGFQRVSLQRMETRSVSEITRSAGRRGRNRESRIESQEQQALTQVEKLVAAMQDNDVEFSLNLDGREVASSTKPLLDEGTNNRGRFSPR